MIDDDLETCSWCTDEVHARTLREAPDGALVCKECQLDHAELSFRIPR